MFYQLYWHPDSQTSRFALALAPPLLPPGQRLKEAWELQQFLRSTEDELVWMREAEALLSSEDIGRDLQAVRFLLKKHQVTWLIRIN